MKTNSTLQIPLVVFVITIFLVAGFLLWKSLIYDRNTNNMDNLKSTNSVEGQLFMEGNTIITMEEVLKHNTRGDCWIVIDNEVYDATNFIPTHPGKDEIVKGCGRDATGMFKSRPTTGTSHSEEAMNILKSLKIGVLK